MFNLNGQLIKELPGGLALAERGLYYADALFEAIRVFGGRIPLMERHWARLSKGLTMMRYDVPADWSGEYFKKEILRIAPQNARVRLSVWRPPGGLYFPENDTPQFLITAAVLESDMFEWHSEGIRTGLCESVRLPVDLFSGLKTLNAARYVAAAQEAGERGWDDAIMLNAYDRVCEASGSNVFWFENGTLCTPPLADGCVTGVMRDLLLTLTKAAGYTVIEKSSTFAGILAAEEVFLSNAVKGVRYVREIEGRVFDCVKTRALFDLVAGYIFQKLKE